MALDTVIDLDRYPLDDLGGGPGAALLAQCRDEFDTVGACCLEGFMRTDAVARALDQSSVERPWHRDIEWNAFSQPPEAALPDHEAHHRFFPMTVDVLAGDQIPAGHPLRTIHEDAQVAAFLSAVTGRPVFPFADRFQAINVVTIEPGDQHGWHYDRSDLVITVLLQQPERGGEFEFAPFVRGREVADVRGGLDGRVWDEREDDVAAVLDGTWADLHQVDLAPGTLMIFNGERSLHRVRPVAGGRARKVGVLSYDSEADMVSTAAVNERLYGPRVRA